MNLNKAIIIGRLTQDPEMRSTPSGQSVCSFSMATNRVWSDKASGQKKEETDFHNIVVWGRLAEIASQYLVKGSEALIEGRIRTRSWDDKSGVKKYRTEIIAERLQLGQRPGGQGGRNFQANTGQDGSSANSSGAKPAAPASPAVESIPIIEDDGDDEIRVEDIPF